MDHKKLARVMDWSSLSKPRSVDGSDTYVTVSIRSSPDNIEDQRPVKGYIICVAHTFSAFWSPILAFIWSLIYELWGYWFLFAMHAVASPFLCIWGCMTLDIKYFVAAASVIQHLIICLVMTVCLPITMYSRMLKKKRPLLEVSQEKLFVISCITVLLDPLFFYIPTIDEKNKCLDMDNKLMIVVLALRSLSDLFFICRIATRIQLFHDELVDSGSKNRHRWLACNYLCNYFCSLFCDSAEMRLRLLLKWIQSDSVLNLLPILPVQQVAIIITFFRLGSSGYSYKTAILNIFLVLQLISRGYHIYRFRKHFQITREKANVALNFFLYILAAYVLGALWYIFSIQRETSCWHKVCKKTAGCITTYYCNSDTSTSPSVTILNERCPVRHEDAIVNYGIYLDAFRSGTTNASINFPTKVLYTFWWGFRNLSNFGTNLVTSNDLWENFLAVLISVIGMFLFSCLIGNVQICMQSKDVGQIEDEALRRKIKMMMENEILGRVSSFGHSEDTKTQSKGSIKINKVVDENIDVDVNLLPIHPSNIKQSTDPDIFSPPISNQDVICQTKVEALALTVKGLESVLSYYRDRLYRSNEQLEESAPIIPLGSPRCVAPADNSVSSSTTLDQRLDQLLQLQVSQGRRLEEMAAKLGFGATTPAI